MWIFIYIDGGKTSPFTELVDEPVAAGGGGDGNAGGIGLGRHTGPCPNLGFIGGSGQSGSSAEIIFNLYNLINLICINRQQLIYNYLDKKHNEHGYQK